MKEFLSCFGESDIQIVDSSSSGTTRAFQNEPTCVYQCESRGRSCLITISWTQKLIGQVLSIGTDDSSNQCLCKIEIKPWLFSEREGSKTLLVDSSKVDIFWNLTCAKFGDGLEPLGGFYLAVVCNQQVVLLLGDLKNEACKKIDGDHAHYDAVLIARRQHIYGKKSYNAKSPFCDKGKMHDVIIECDKLVGEPCLVIQIDNKIVVQVERLQWKFRGNQTILVDGFPLEVIWDVHDWLFGNAMGNAVFVFQTRFTIEKMRACQFDEDSPAITRAYSQHLREHPYMQGHDFSLILYAWKTE